MTLAPFEHFIVNFSKSYPFQGARAGYTVYACYGLIHLVHTELTQSQTLCQLSQHRMRLHVNWVNAEWDSTSTESTQNTPTFTKILSFRIDSVDVESHLALIQLTRNETSHQLSHRRMLKNLNKSANSRTKWKNLKVLLFGLYVFDKCKKREQKISWKCTFKEADRDCLSPTSSQRLIKRGHHQRAENTPSSHRTSVTMIAGSTFHNYLETTLPRSR